MGATAMTDDISNLALIDLLVRRVGSENTMQLLREEGVDVPSIEELRLLLSDTFLRCLQRVNDDLDRHGES